MNDNPNPYQEHIPARDSGTGVRLLITLGGLSITVIGALLLAFNLLSNYDSPAPPRATNPGSAPVDGPDTPGGQVSQKDMPDEPPAQNTPPAGSPEIRDGDMAGKYMKVRRIPTPYKYSYYIGLYKNTGSVPLRKPRLELQFLDADGNVISTSKKYYTYGARGSIQPGESVPFRLLITQVPPHKSWRILHKPQKPYTIRPRLKLKITNARIGEKDRFGAYPVTGSIVNLGDEVASLIKLIALMYDAEGEIVGHTTSYLQTKRLGPGEKANFQFRVRNVPSQPAKLVMDYSGWVYRGTTKTKRSKAGASSVWPE